MPDLTILQAVIHATGEDDRETVLDVLNEYRLAADPAAVDPDPLTTVDTGRVYATRTTTDTGELLAAALLDTTHGTAFTITQYHTGADNGLYIAHTPQDGTRRAQCNAHGTPVSPHPRDESARPAAGIQDRIRPFLDLSTLHLAPTTRDTLDTTGGVLSYPLEHGWLMYAPVGAADLARTHAWPEELLPIVQLARAHDCAYVLFDSDADTTDLLPVFDD